MVYIYSINKRKSTKTIPLKQGFNPVYDEDSVPNEPIRRNVSAQSLAPPMDSNSGPSDDVRVEITILYFHNIDRLILYPPTRLGYDRYISVRTQEI